jgi:hypothetical protein
VFQDSDHENAPRVVIVNERLAATLWPNGDVLGKRIRAGRASGQDWATVIGVVGSVRHDSLSREPGPELYTHFPQNPVVATSLVLSTTGDPRALAGPVRAVIWNSSREVPISNLRTIDEVLSRSTTRYRVLMTLLATFAAVGVLLGLVGIYGLVAHSVRQRTREIGIRMALGATPRNVQGLMTTVGLRWAALGIVVGLSLAFALTSFLRGLVFGVATRDPITFTMVPLLLFACALLAAYLPARRAAATQPAAVLLE